MQVRRRNNLGLIRAKLLWPELSHKHVIRKTGKERGRGWPMSEIKCWFLSLALQGSGLHTGHLLAAFQNNQKEVQSCRGEGLEAVTDPPVRLFSTTFTSLEVKGRGFLLSLQA